MSFRLDISAGALFELVRPVGIIISAIVSTWVLASARRRFPLYQSLLWALASLFFPLIVFPLYLFALFLKWRSTESRSPYLPTPKRRFGLTLVYALVLLGSIAAYLYFDDRSLDAHLARAVQARLNGDRATAIREYQKALALEDNPHTHKLLAIELVEAGYLSEAVSEFRLAESGGEPDDAIHFRLGSVLDRLNQTGQARLEFQNFLLSQTCQRIDSRCDAARLRLENTDR